MQAQIRSFDELQANESTRMAQLEDNIKLADENLARQKGAVETIEGTITTQEKELTELRGTERECDSRFTELEVKLAEERSQAGFLEETLRSEYAIEVAEIDWKDALWKAEASKPKAPESNA